MPGILGGAWTRLTLANRPRRQFTFSPNLAATITPDGKYSVRHQREWDLAQESWMAATLGSSWRQDSLRLCRSRWIPAILRRSTCSIYRGLHKSTDGGATFAAVTTPISARSLAVDSIWGRLRGRSISSCFTRAPTERKPLRRFRIARLVQPDAERVGEQSLRGHLQPVDSVCGQAGSIGTKHSVLYVYWRKQRRLYQWHGCRCARQRGAGRDHEFDRISR